MKTTTSPKFDFVKQQTLFPYLSESSKDFVETLCTAHAFTFQELRKITEYARDLEMWEEGPLAVWWQEFEARASAIAEPVARKKDLLKQLEEKMRAVKSAPKVYPPRQAATLPKKDFKVTAEETDHKIFGDCPVASPKTVCCNLKTIDAVENCAFACSYCSVQTFYGDEVVVNRSLRQRLQAMELDPDRFYHFGTGQSSDALVWGNAHGMLDDLCDFARKHPNVLLEFKTKSHNTAYFARQTVPSNVVCSWSLNTDCVIENEELLTANLDRRLEAARNAADHGIKVAFHFHPILYYDGWCEDYPALAQRVMQMFRPEEVLFMSMGSATFIKPVMKAIRKKGVKTKILQMEMVKDPHGKLTYPDDLKVEMFQTMYAAFKPWQKKVYQYLCMEKAEIWDRVYGWHYATNDLFEQDFGKHTLPKKT